MLIVEFCEEGDARKIIENKGEIRWFGGWKWIRT